MHQFFQKINQIKVLVLFGFLLFIINPGFGQTNQIVNGGFENGQTGWAIWGGKGTISTDAHTGSSALLMTDRSQSWHAPAQDVTGSIINGEEFTLSVWIKLLGECNDLRATVAVNVDGNTTYKQVFTAANAKVGSYINYTESDKITWTGNLTSVNLYFETSSDKDGKYPDYLIDDVILSSGLVTEPGDTIITKGWKDIKSTMKVGWCATDGKKTIFTHPKAKALTLSNCNSTNVQCYPAWGRWDETLKHVYRLDAFNNQVKELKKENIFVTAHMLLGWDQYFPDWYLKGDFHADTVEAIMKSWIKSIITFKGNDTLVDNWNVVNETMMWDGKGSYWPTSGVLKNSCEMQRMGFEPDASGLPADQIVNTQHPIYIRKSFEEARKFTTKKLELRDASIEFPTDQKYKSFYQLVVHLLKSGTPLDAVGLQTHLDIANDYDWEGYANNIKRYKKLGLDVYIDEVDFGDSKKDWNGDKAQRQKMQYYKLVTAAIRGGADLFETWGFIDNNNTGWRYGENAWPFDGLMNPKPAYFGVKDALTDMSHILFWEMDAIEEEQMKDVMSYHNNGILNNIENPTFEAGFLKKALLFDGVDDYLSTNKLSDTLGDFSFSCFIKAKETKSAVIAVLGNDDSKSLSIVFDETGKLAINSSSKQGILSSSLPLTDNQWHFVALKRNADTLMLYIDGAKTDLTALAPSEKYSTLTLAADANGKQNFGGLIDEVKLYDWAVDDSSYFRSITPLTPSEFKIQKYSSYLKLLWKDESTNEDGFIVERKKATGNWEVFDTVAPNVSFLNDKSYAYSTEYTYRVKAFNKFGESVYSNMATVTTAKDPNVGLKTMGKEKELSNIYPNPANGNFMLHTPLDGEMKILTLSGYLVGSRKVFAGENNFDSSNLKNGLYLISVANSQGVESLKLSVKR
jgi:GH35 family endo-1,4-beta-xylanase